jgi:hypothetical protein
VKENIYLETDSVGMFRFSLLNIKESNFLALSLSSFSFNVPIILFFKAVIESSFCKDCSIVWLLFNHEKKKYFTVYINNLICAKLNYLYIRYDIADKLEFDAYGTYDIDFWRWRIL